MCSSDFTNLAAICCFFSLRLKLQGSVGKPAVFEKMQATFESGWQYSSLCLRTAVDVESNENARLACRWSSEGTQSKK